MWNRVVIIINNKIMIGTFNLTPLPMFKEKSKTHLGDLVC